MGNFFEKFCKFVVNLIVIALILLVSVQIIMKDELASKHLEKIEMVVRNIFTQEEKLIKVSKTDIQETKGIIVIDLLQDLSLANVWLLRNGEKVANFKSGVARINIKPGDHISINSSFYSQPLWFEVTYLSPSVSTWQIGKQFRTTGDRLKLGIVEFENKL